MAVKWRGIHYFEGLKVAKKEIGGDSQKGFIVAVEPMAHAKGYRQGAANIQVVRGSDQAFIATWDGNPDVGLLIAARNYGNCLDGATRIGATRGMSLSARNSGTNLSWVGGIQLGVRNDSGKNVSEMYGQKIICENYGNIYTSNYGLIIQMLDENTTQSQERIGLAIQNVEQSGMSAVNAAIKISHTSTNGFSKLLKLGSATGDSYTAKATAVGSLGNTLGYLEILIGTTVARIAVFDEWA